MDRVRGKADDERGAEAGARHAAGGRHAGASAPPWRRLWQEAESTGDARRGHGAAGRPRRHRQDHPPCWGPSAALLLNALKALAGIDKESGPDLRLQVIEPISDMKTAHLGHHNPRLHSDEVLIALSISALTNPLADLVQKQLHELRGCDAHFSVILVGGGREAL